MKQIEKNGPAVSIVIPCYKEQDYIAKTLDSMLGQDYAGDLEIIVADGMSNDGTRDIVNTYSVQHPSIRLIDNPKKIVPTGLNAGIKQASYDIIIRIDAHTTYAKDYVSCCVASLLETGAANVGGPWRASGESYLQKAIAFAFSSPFSSGGASSHNVSFTGIVDSVYLGCWYKKTLVDVGLFDEELVRNQDDELNYRIQKAGLKIWQDANINSWYTPRASLVKLFRQYFQYGYWKVRVIQKHRLPAKLRHLVPGLFVLALIVSAIGALFSQYLAIIAAIIAACYVLAVVAISLIDSMRNKGIAFLPILPIIYPCFHFGYGAGFLKGVLDFVVLKKSPGTVTHQEITR